MKIKEGAFEDGRKAYHASRPALSGCHTWGHTEEEALTNIQDTVEVYVEDLITSSDSVPAVI